MIQAFTTLLLYTGTSGGDVCPFAQVLPGTGKLVTAAASAGAARRNVQPVAQVVFSGKRETIRLQPRAVFIDHIVSQIKSLGRVGTAR